MVLAIHGFPTVTGRKLGRVGGRNAEGRSYLIIILQLSKDAQSGRFERPGTGVEGFIDEMIKSIRHHVVGGAVQRFKVSGGFSKALGCSISVYLKMVVGIPVYCPNCHFQRENDNEAVKLEGPN